MKREFPHKKILLKRKSFVEKIYKKENSLWKNSTEKEETLIKRKALIVRVEERIGLKR